MGRTPGLRLLQVQVVARHGSRTPYKVYDPTCWSGYGFVWNCNVTEMTQAGSTDGGVDGDPAPWIFRKVGACVAFRLFLFFVLEPAG